MMDDIRRCPACGAKHRGHRRRCLRCGAAFEEPALAAPTRSRWRVSVSALALVGLAALGWRLVATGERPHVLAGQVALPVSGTASVPAERGPAREFASTAPAVDPMPAASAAYARGDYGAALLGFQRAMAEHPQDAAAMNNVGQVLVRLGRAAEAVPLLEKAVAEKPGEWSYRFNLARAHAQLLDWPAALESYRVADRLFPDDGPTLYNLGLALQQTGADAEAASVLERAGAALPGDASVLLALGRSYQRLSRAADARQAFSRFLEMSPQSPDAAAARTALAALAGAAPPPAAPGAAPSAAVQATTVAAMRD